MKWPDFFPADCIGASRKAEGGNGVAIRVFIEGLRETIETDIGSDARTGKPRRFFEYHSIRTGDALMMSSSWLGRILPSAKRCDASP